MKTRNKKQLVADPQCGQSIIINAGVNFVHGLTLTRQIERVKARSVKIPGPCFTLGTWATSKTFAYSKPPIMNAVIGVTGSPAI